MSIPVIEAELEQLVSDINQVRAEMIALHQTFDTQADDLNTLLGEVAEIAAMMESLGEDVSGLDMPEPLSIPKRQYDLIQEATLLLPPDVREKLEQDYQHAVPEIPPFDKLDWSVIFFVGVGAVLADIFIVGMPTEKLEAYIEASVSERQEMFRTLMDEMQVELQANLAKLSMVEGVLERTTRHDNEDPNATPHPLMDMLRVPEVVDVMRRGVDVAVLLREGMSGMNPERVDEAIDLVPPEQLVKMADWLSAILKAIGQHTDIESPADLLSMLASEATGKEVNISQEELASFYKATQDFYRTVREVWDELGSARIPAMIEITITLYAWLRETQSPTDLEGSFWGSGTPLNLVSPRQAKRRALSFAAHGIATLGNIGKVSFALVTTPGNFYYALSSMNPVQWQWFTAQAVHHVMYVARSTATLEQVLLNRERLNKSREMLLSETSIVLYQSDLSDLRPFQIKDKTEIW